MTDQQTEPPSSEQSSTTTTTTTTTTQSSALRDNIARKGKNAYYFAHAHKATGPEWDGKEEPKLLAKTTTSASNSTDSDDANAHAMNHLHLQASTKAHSTFDFKSNITSYAFSDEGATVKLYIAMEGVGEKCSDEDITLDHTAHSFCFQVRNYATPALEDLEDTAEGGDAPEPPILCLSFLKLTADISKATFKKKKDRVVVILHKADKDREWHTINDKGTPDHEVV